MDRARFFIKRMLGRGSFGVTYLAYDKKLRKDVALKIITLESEESTQYLRHVTSAQDLDCIEELNHESSLVRLNGGIQEHNRNGKFMVGKRKVKKVEYEKAKKNALDEIEALKTLSNWDECNEYIVCYYDSFIVTETVREHGSKVSTKISDIFIVSEYIDGMTLQEYIRGNMFFSAKVLLSIMYGLVKGLMFIHEGGYAHGDIKTDNIMITKSGHVKYIDFGLACIQECEPEDCDNSCSIPRTMSETYTSPDYYRTNERNGNLAMSNDVWSLGVVLYQLVNKGNLPFDHNIDSEILRRNILNAPKYKSKNRYQSINAYVDSFLVNNCQNRPNIQTQHAVLTNIIHTNQDIITEEISPDPPLSPFVGKYIYDDDI